MPDSPRKLAAAAAPSARVFALILLAALIWIAHFDRWTAASWALPTDYGGDAHETLARLKAASEGELRPLMPQVISRLGAPFGAYWNAYPTPDKPLMVALGALVDLIGLHATANLGLLLAQVSAALAFYFVARWFRTDWAWAAAGALVFAYTYHTFHRGLAHFSLVFTWTVPLGLLAAWLIAGSRRLEWRSLGAMVCLGAGAALGIANPYNLFFWLLLMAFAVLAQLFGARRRANLEIAAATIGVAVLAFVAVNIEVWLHIEDARALPLLARNYGGTERYALKPVEMFIPPEFHRWDWMAFFGRRYVRWSEWRGEVFLPYLGIVGIAGFVCLIGVTLRAILRRRPLPGQALSIGWLVAYGTIGGVTNLLAFFFGLQVFRATNRVAIFISCIVLLFLVVRLSRWTARWPRWAVAVLAAGVATIGVLDQLPRPAPRHDTTAIAKAVAYDGELGRALDAALPPGAMVFQLPVLGFPEVIPPFQLDSYEHFRPYLTTEHVRFSYGAAKLRSRSRWQREVENLPTPDLVRYLERCGFSALYINQRGFPDSADRLLSELGQLGYTRRLQLPGSVQVLVFLNPRPDPVLPLAHTFSFGSGWHQLLDGSTRWAYDDGAMAYHNPYAAPIEVDISFQLVAVTPRAVTLLQEDAEVRTIDIGREPTVVTTRVTLVPGINHFTLSSPTPGIRGQRQQLRSFGVRSVSIRSTPPLDPLYPRTDALLAGRN